MFFMLALITLLVLGLNYAVNYKLKNVSVKYANFDAFEDETGETLGKIIYSNCLVTNSIVTFL